MAVWRFGWWFLHMGAWMLVATTTEQHAQAHEEHYMAAGSPYGERRQLKDIPNVVERKKDDMGVDGLYTVLVRRHLLASDIDNASIPLNVSEDCADIDQPHDGYNNSCDYVQKNCQGQHELIPYLNIVMCNLQDVKPLAYILLIIWLLYLLSLLSTTVRYFFVPPLTMLADKLHLPPSIAGITLLALGNGAPDIFVAMSALEDGDLALVLGSLMGAGIFITAVVLGTVILVSTMPYKIDKIDVTRDILAYMVVLGVIIGVAYDGKVYLVEAALFPLIYVLYIAAVIILSYIRFEPETVTLSVVQLVSIETWLKKRKLLHRGIVVLWHKDPTGESDVVSLLHEEVAKSIKVDKGAVVPKPLLRDEVKKSIKVQEGEAERKPLLRDEVAKTIKEERTTYAKKHSKLTLNGLTLPKGMHIAIKFQWFVEWPFSLLRWLTIPHCYHDGCWSRLHFFFTVLSPVPMSLLLLLVFQKWNGYSMNVGDSGLPLCVLLILIALGLCIVLFFILSSKRPPNSVMQIVLMIGAFCMSIAWLNLEANEIVSILQALGLLFNVNTAILGLTVLAIGNSVADWVADSVVAMSGKPEMAVGSCFGAPLLSNVIGLSIALLFRILTREPDIVFTFEIGEEKYVHVKLAWIFLGICLVGSLVLFPLFRFRPPKTYGVVLIYTYLVFMLFSVLTEVNVLDIKL